MNAEILSIGSELMAGRICDTNAAYLSDHLTQIGYRVQRHTCVGDSRQHIMGAIKEISKRADIALVTGGLGPTRDDPTRYCFADCARAALVEDRQSTLRMRGIFKARGMVPSESNFAQALIPKGAKAIRNPTGTAAGFSVKIGKCRFFCLPGVPSEMVLMFRQIEPLLRKKSAGVTIVRSLHSFGIGESIIGERLYELMAEDHNPQVATQAREGTITVRLTAMSTTKADARKKILQTEKVIMERLGNAIFGYDDDSTLQQAVANLLTKAGLTLAVAESCTGGEISARLTDVPGSSAFLMEAAVTYSNESKVKRLGVSRKALDRDGAVSSSVVELMASGIRKTSGADIGLSVTGIAGPSGATAAKPVGLVYMAIADNSGVRSEERHFVGSRQQIKDRAAKTALNMLRLHLIKRD